MNPVPTPTRVISRSGPSPPRPPWKKSNGSIDDVSVTFSFTVMFTTIGVTRSASAATSNVAGVGDWPCGVVTGAATSAVAAASAMRMGVGVAD